MTRIFRLMCIYIDASADGLPLGYQTSQLLALLFLDEFDHFVKERLRIKYYVRYMDDFLLIHPDKEYLRYCQKQIETFLTGLRLELNEKTNIFPLRHGVDFLGFHTYITESGQIIRKLRHSSVKRMKRENQEVEEGLSGPARPPSERSWIAGPPGTLMRPMATPTHSGGRSLQRSRK